MKTNRWLLILALLPMSLCAQDNLVADTLSVQPVVNPVADSVAARPQTHAYMVGVGVANVLDTYISPEKYHGLSLRYISASTRWSRRHAHLTYHVTHQGEFDYTHNRADNNNEIGGLYNFQYAVHYNWRLAVGRIMLHAGGGLDVGLGFLYNTRNSNNPAQARLELNLSPSAGARYKFSLARHTCCLNYDVMLPLFGVMFSPNYGQSYYEIFSKGDYDHNVVPTTFVSKPSMRHMLSVDFPIGHTWMRVGYMGDYQQAHVNGLKMHNYAHMLVIGIVTHFSLNRYRP